ncbi:hypothetical protein [Sphingobium sp. Ant17]|uniref:hypothetical protein n=1 Tax=Sphingobium sp. Ant17 TaxID=1461752 RepID=UPI001268C209|nr:hypothetical protein [Sphingobium sp. Ant17]
MTAANICLTFGIGLEKSLHHRIRFRGTFDADLFADLDEAFPGSTRDIRQDKAKLEVQLANTDELIDWRGHLHLPLDIKIDTISPGRGRQAKPRILHRAWRISTVAPPTIRASAQIVRSGSSSSLLIDL